ncbi:MAG: hypothetical protein LBP67_04185 [Bacteroidales bacterium]|jgi:hypothetical protein|nr:hypothetical protein [Bacteroidales bacterium]
MNNGCISLEATMCDSIHGEFALDNGMGISLLDSTFFYSKFDTSKFILKKDNSYDYFKFQVYYGEIPVYIGEHKFIIIEFRVKNCRDLGIPDLNGIIGAEAFISKITVVDFETQNISFMDSLSVDSLYEKIPMHSPMDRSNGHSKFVDITFYNNNKEAINGFIQFDLGLNGTELQCNQSFAKQIAKTEKHVTGNIHTPTQKNKVQFWNINSLKLGKYYIHNIELVTSYIEMNGKLEDPMLMFKEGDGCFGLEFIKRFNLIVDYKTDFLYLKPNKYFD